jgi:hypothetical protein
VHGNADQVGHHQKEGVSCAYDRAKKRYLNERKRQADIIVERLKQKGYETARRSSGGSAYGKRSNPKTRIDPPYDLSNWIWVSTKDKGSSCSFNILLHTFDQDPGSKNHHVFIDRLSLRCHYPKASKLAPDTTLTGLDLPLEEDALEKLMSMFDAFVNECKKKL